MGEVWPLALPECQPGQRPVRLRMVAAMAGQLCRPRLSVQRQGAPLAVWLAVSLVPVGMPVLATASPIASQNQEAGLLDRRIPAIRPAAGQVNRMKA